MNILLINHYAGGTTQGMEFRPFYICLLYTSIAGVGLKCTA